MATSLGLKQGSLSDIERGKTKGLSTAVSSLLKQIYFIDTEYFYHNSEKMFLRDGAIGKRGKKATLSKVPTEQIVRYIIKNERNFRNDALFSAYLDAVVSSREAERAAEDYAKIREAMKKSQDHNGKKDS